MAARDFVIENTASGMVLKQYKGQEREIAIPQGVRIIGERAFANNPHLVQVIIPEGVEDIGEEAFAGDVNLELVSLPASMSSISATAFRGCKNLRIFDVDPANQDWKEVNAEGMPLRDLPKGPVQQADLQLAAEEAAGPAKRPKKELQKAPKPRKAPGSPTAAEMKKIWGFKKLPDNTLQLTDYKICPEGQAGKLIAVPARIGRSAVTELRGTFKGKRGIDNARWAEVIRLPEGLRVIGNETFSGCDRLKEAALPDTVVRIGENAFSGSRELKRLRIPPSVCRVGAWAFAYSGLEEIVLPDSVKHLGSCLFYRCVKLSSVTLPKTMRRLPDSIFESCKTLQTVELPAGLRRIGDRAFAASGLTSLVLPEGVVKIGRSAFFRCERLQSLTIPASVEQIEDGAFGAGGLDPEQHIPVTIHAPAGCYAEDYARRHQLRFEAL